MAGLNNPTAPATEDDPDFVIIELLTEIAQILRRIEFHLQVASDEEIENEDVSHDSE